MSLKPRLIHQIGTIVPDNEDYGWFDGTRICYATIDDALWHLGVLTDNLIAESELVIDVFITDDKEMMKAVLEENGIETNSIDFTSIEYMQVVSRPMYHILGTVVKHSNWVIQKMTIYEKMEV